ncbi:MAG TPA: N-acetyltransferase [Bacteroidia bacterium]|nr:N-acetyltransferase [Bacteroidia bacterium]
MFITELSSEKKHKVVVEPVTKEDYKIITKRRYFFDWKTERQFSVYKLRRSDDDTILGLVSFENYQKEKWIDIRLLSVSFENRGSKKKYDRIAGTLIGYVCREAIKLYANKGCVALVPKGDLGEHYMSQYGMKDAGKRLFLDGEDLLKILNTYEI